jgi:short-subunit dehydrogenase
MLSARSAEQLTEAEAALGATGAEVSAHVADVSKPDGAAGAARMKGRPGASVINVASISSGVAAADNVGNTARPRRR